MPDDRIAFPLETLLAAGEATQPLSVCAEGHLVVAGRTHWKPEALDPTMRSLVCDWIEVCTG